MSLSFEGELSVGNAFNLFRTDIPHPGFSLESTFVASNGLASGDNFVWRHTSSDSLLLVLGGTRSSAAWANNLLIKEATIELGGSTYTTRESWRNYWIALFGNGSDAVTSGSILSTTGYDPSAFDFVLGHSLGGAMVQLWERAFAASSCRYFTIGAPGAYTKRIDKQRVSNLVLWNRGCVDVIPSVLDKAQGTRYLLDSTKVIDTSGYTCPQLTLSLHTTRFYSSFLSRNTKSLSSAFPS
jgi:hypothetical protein